MLPDNRHSPMPRYGPASARRGIPLCRKKIPPILITATRAQLRQAKTEKRQARSGLSLSRARFLTTIVRNMLGIIPAAMMIPTTKAIQNAPFRSAGMNHPKDRLNSITPTAPQVRPAKTGSTDFGTTGFKRLKSSFKVTPQPNVCPSRCYRS